MKRPFFALAAALLMAVSFTGCNKKPSDQYAGIDGDYVTGTPLGDRVEGSNFFGNTVQRGRFQPVYFAYDSSSVGASEKGKIAEVASAFKGSGKSLIVAGFTDDRGTPEYNRGLGERRALAVREALIHAGVPAGKIQTVSFGQEMPADPGTGEAAWAKNRRAEFGVVK